MLSDSNLRATLRLTLADGVGAKTVSRLVEAFGSVAEAAAVGPVGWKRIRGIGPKTLAALRAVTGDQIEEEIREAARLGASVIPLGSENYPTSLKTIPDPPAVLYVRGRLEAADAVALGVVGSRHCSHYGLEQAERFGALLGRAGLTVVSGGARGIDTAAHRGALNAGGRTIAVMGCGLAQTYPPENAELFERIVSEDAGALISELPMRTAVLAGNFPTRNRIISGLSLGVLVVEAGLPSGALITAREAAEQGRDVFAMPGRVDSPSSAGTHQLLRDGAHLTADLDDILSALGDVGAVLGAEEDEDAPTIAADLTEDEQKLVEALRAAPQGLDDLVERTGLATGVAAAAMTMLVLKGAVVQRPGNVFEISRR